MTTKELKMEENWTELLRNAVKQTLTGNFTDEPRAAALGVRQIPDNKPVVIRENVVKEIIDLLESGDYTSKYMSIHRDEMVALLSEFIDFVK